MYIVYAFIGRTLLFLRTAKKKDARIVYDRKSFHIVFYNIFFLSYEAEFPSLGFIFLGCRCIVSAICMVIRNERFLFAFWELRFLILAF